MLDDLDKDTKNILIGAAIGGVLGLGLSMIIAHSSKHKHQPLEFIGQALNQFGDLIDKGAHECKHLCKDARCMMHNVEKTLNKGDNTVAHVMELVTAALQVWNKLKKG